MTDAATAKSAEERARKQGYAQGYNAGKRRLDREDARTARDQEREDFRRAVFLAALPSYLSGTWTRGEKPMTTTVQRVELAWNCADEAVKNIRSIF